MNDDLIMPVDAFIRSIQVNKTQPHSLFLGAGASISSGIPSANRCIWHWKREIFTSNNPLLKNQVTELGLTSVQEQIQKWLDSEGSYPQSGSDSEYSFYIENCFPIIEDRRQYFSQLVTNIKPYVGYQWLCLLSEANLYQYVWTTNFDCLTVKAAMNSEVTPIEIGLDTSNRINNIAHEVGKLVCVALHGDYRYDQLKNTKHEIKQQDQHLHKAFQEHLKASNLIVIGYSGRDESIMESLTKAYSKAGTGRIYWCGYGEDSRPDKKVRTLLETAIASGRRAVYVPSLGFDDLMWRTTKMLSGQTASKAEKIFTNYQQTKNRTPPPFKIPLSNSKIKIANVIKGNSFAVEPPTDIYQFSASGFDSIGAWSRLRQQIDGTGIVAGLLKGQVLALGSINEIKKVFAKNLNSAIQRVPISSTDLALNEGVITHLLTSALSRAIARKTNLDSDGRNLIWQKTSSRSFSHERVAYKVYDAARITLRFETAQLRMVIEPTIVTLTQNGQPPTREAQDAARRNLLAGQYNKIFNDKLDEWRKTFFESRKTTFSYPSKDLADFAFSVTNVPDFASIVEYKPYYPINLPDNFVKNIKQQGMRFQEPELVFSNSQGQNYVYDTHSLRGISKHQPYDYSLTKQGLETDIKLGVICPKEDANQLQSFLLKLQQSSDVTSNPEYMVSYTGFGTEFGIPLQIPEPSNNRWAACSDVDLSLNVKDGAKKIRDQLVSSINNLIASGNPNVIIVYVPERWKKWELYKQDDEYFNLHDYIKAYCVEKGIASQFLREKTLRDSDVCRVKWWLALALYVKSMRTPWALKSHDADTAFLGIGMSIDQTAMKGNHIILGCSHIYNSLGIGLTYKLSKIHDPIWRNRNPFLGIDDARQMGDSARQLFYSSMGKLPNRVVIHKRTPFSSDEIRGLQEGLSGVAYIDMLEINIDSARRYVSSKYQNNKFEGDGFPVKRGTSILLDKYKALCWVHGSAHAIQPNRTYYQGKRRIPAPLAIIRHFGEAPLKVLVPELLGLSKMDWNTFDMYTKLPATIQSSNSIARIGSHLNRFGDNSYDYRLFI